MSNLGFTYADVQWLAEVVEFLKTSPAIVHPRQWEHGEDLARRIAIRLPLSRPIPPTQLSL